MNATFEPANLLEIALKAANDDPASRPQFYRTLLDSKVLIVPVGEKPRIVNGVIPEGSAIRLAEIEFGGNRCVPFFTSEKRLPAGTEYFMLDARALFEMTRGAYLLLNPGAPYGKEFVPDEVARLLDGTIFEPQERFVIQKAMEVMIGQPKDYPKELVDALSRLYAKNHVVKRAWVALYHNLEKGAESGLLIGLDLDNPQEMDRISGESGIVIQSIPKKQSFVDLVKYDPSGVAGYFTNQKPFYQRNSLKGLWNKIRS
jgi:hypothetical protein